MWDRVERKTVVCWCLVGNQVHAGLITGTECSEIGEKIIGCSRLLTRVILKMIQLGDNQISEIPGSICTSVKTRCPEISLNCSWIRITLTCEVCLLR